MAALLSTTMPELAITTELFWNYSSTADYIENHNLTVCAESSTDCVIDHTKQCVGDPAYCNLTESEYLILIYEYIWPSVPEWILICSHIVVFLMGLVSVKFFLF